MTLKPDPALVATRKEGKVFGLVCNYALTHALYTIAELAQMAGCSKRKVRKAIERATL